MSRASLLPVVSLLFLAACVTTPDGSQNGLPFLEDLPEGLAERAAPDQNLARVVIMPGDGCYWYEHRNVVETTLLPLRTRDGRPICSRPAL